MGRIYKWVLLIAIFVSVAAPRKDAAAEIKIVTTSTDLASIAKFVGGDKVEVNHIIQGYQNPHYVDVRPSYMLKLHKADMFVKVGLDLELWAPVLAQGARNKDIIKGGPGYVDASIGAEILEIPQVRVTRELGDIHIYGNPHYWMDPLNGKVIADNILAGLKRVDPKDSKYFEKNNEAFDKKIDEMLPKWEEMMKPYLGTKIVTYHQTWPNFAKRFGLVVIGYVEPKPGVPPSPSHITSLIETMKAEDVKIILQEPFYETKISEFVAKKTDAVLVVASPSVMGEEGAPDYFSLFDHLLGKLISAFREAGIKPKS